MSGRAVTITGVGLLLALALYLMGGIFSYSSICRHCGASQSGRRCFIPDTQICYFHATSVHATPVSKVLESTGIVGAHEHDWRLAQGGGNGIFCAIGEGRHLTGVKSENVASLISAADRFGETAFRDEMVKALLEPKSSHLVYALEHRVEGGDLADAETFHSWLAEHSDYFTEQLTMAQGE